MKSLIKNFVATDETHEDFNLGVTIAMVLLFLSFIGSTFYLMVTG